MLLSSVTLLALFLASGEKQNKINEEEDRVVEIKDEYDFVIVGAGTAGCALAARLAGLSGVNTLVLEAGQSGRGEVKVDVPVFAPQLHNTHRDWNITVTPQKNAISRTGPKTFAYPRGRVGGGTSAFNYQVYIRGNKHEYRLWEDQGATGWNLNNLTKYFNKVENGVGEGISESTKNKNGKIKLAKIIDLEHQKIIHNAANEIGIPSVDYLDGGGLKMGMSKMTKAVVNGKRQYGLNSYLHPAWMARKSSLDVVYGALVNKILFHDVNGEKKAYAVRFEHEGVVKEVRARKEIILSAGAFNSPQLLMLSGVGPRKHLEDIGIEVVIDLPGVGSNVEDHTVVPLHYYGDNYPNEAIITYDKAIDTISEYTANGTGPMGTVLAFDNQLNVRSKSKAAFSSDKYPFPDINVHTTAFGATINEPDPDKDFSSTYDEATRNRNGTLYHMSFWGFLCHPRSRGTIRLQSENPKDSVLYDPNIFGKSRDFKLMLELIRIAEKMEQSSEFKKYGLKMTMVPDHCKIKNMDKIPRPKSFYECYAGHTVWSLYHGTSSCPIGRRDNKKAVVDPRLRVYGLSNLRIADASVMPHVTSANTHATCYVIGEKAADIIKEDWKLTVDE